MCGSFPYDFWLKIISLLVKMADHDFNFVCVLFIVCILNNVLSVNGDGGACVEPSTSFDYSPPPFHGSPNEPFYEGPNIQPQVVPDYTKSPKEPFYEGPNIQPHVVPDYPKRPIDPFYGGPNDEPYIIPDPPNNGSPNPSCKGGNPINVKYETQSPGGELGIKFSYDSGIDKQMNIMISYDTETTPAASFFKLQCTSCLFQGFTQCGVIKWDIVPCFKSEMRGGQLWCPNGEKQCEFNKIHACIATMYKNDQQKVASFVICFFTRNNNAQECATKSGLNYDDIWKCATDGEGASDCAECNRHIAGVGKPFQRDHGAGLPHPVGVADAGTPEVIANGGMITPDVSNPTGNHEDPSLNGITDFKGAVCAKLNEGKLRCDFCIS